MPGYRVSDPPGGSSLPSASKSWKSSPADVTAVPLNSSVIVCSSGNVAPPVLTVSVEETTPPNSAIAAGSTVTDQGITGTGTLP